MSSVIELLNNVDYSNDDKYIPSEFALHFINFIKLVRGTSPEANKTPVIHYRMLDTINTDKQLVSFMCARGLGKSTLITEYMVLYIAVFGTLPYVGSVNGILFVSDSMDNGVKNFRNSVKERFYNSNFLQKYIKEVKFNEKYIEFTNEAGNRLGVNLYGVSGDVRGPKIFSERPQVAIFDDLLSDSDSRSLSVISHVKDVIYSSVINALDPNKRKVLYVGTPFNSRDPLYLATESGAWESAVFPICEQFPVSREEFRGAWEDRFNYDFVKQQYDNAVANGMVKSFNQELMLRIISEEERVLYEDDYVWFDSSKIDWQSGYNIYITTDFATTNTSSSDYNFILVWAYSSNGDWLLLDGIGKKQLMDKTLDDLFRLASKYKPASVGIEISGQQGGFISWIQERMVNTGIFFNLARNKGAKKAGLKTVRDKRTKFNVVVPLFKTGKIWFPKDKKKKEFMVELLNELNLITESDFKAKHDDAIDAISMIAEIGAWKPTIEVKKVSKDSVYMDLDIEEGDGQRDSYVV